MRSWIHLGIGVVLGAAVASANAKPSGQDPVSVSPQYYRVRLENDRVRVLEYRLPAGQKEAMHTHPDRVGYELSDSVVRLRTPDGKTTDAKGEAGEVFWGPAESHAVENIGTTDSHVLAVELKPCGR